MCARCELAISAFRAADHEQAWKNHLKQTQTVATRLTRPVLWILFPSRYSGLIWILHLILLFISFFCFSFSRRLLLFLCLVLCACVHEWIADEADLQAESCARAGVCKHFRIPVSNELYFFSMKWMLLYHFHLMAHDWRSCACVRVCECL